MGKAKNPSVYLDVSIGGAPAERMVFEVRLFFVPDVFSCIVIINNNNVSIAKHFIRWRMTRFGLVNLPICLCLGPKIILSYTIRTRVVLSTLKRIGNWIFLVCGCYLYYLSYVRDS